MKNKKFKIAIVLAIVLSIGFVTATFAQTPIGALIDEYSGMSEDEYKNALNNKDFDTLVMDIYHDGLPRQ